MSSIGSTLNSINSTLLSEINAFNAKQSQSSANASPTTSSTPSDTVDFSEIGQLLKSLRQLKTTDPAEFKQVLTDAAAQFQTAAGQTTDTRQAAFLNSLAEKFQNAAATGDLSALQPGSSATGLYSPAGHHHHHGGGESAADAASVVNPQGANS